MTGGPPAAAAAAAAAAPPPAADLAAPAVAAPTQWDATNKSPDEGETIVLSIAIR